MNTLQSCFAQIPYGRTINERHIVDNFAFFDDWENRYRYIIDLGKTLPKMPETLRTDERLVRGCQSQVWLAAESENSISQDTVLRFIADSDAFIVRGLIAIVFAALNHKHPGTIAAYDMEAYLEKLALLRHLSQARGNGLLMMVKKIQQIAASANQQPAMVQ